ncbi:MAG: ATP-binding cassette domain-containing protein [Candidatus Omnitrophica bacterium]|nr:ATP-binding cassette domain-containing protein [Candidatus Omnitrophota bacterium]MCM8828784.1 ATP-binding cassette domain-containing protein [Candidatus Omnitrophota bacterium]
MIIETENLYVRLGDTDILKGFNFNVSRGENFVILGPSGSGKTVLLKTLLGLIRPSSGRLVVLGHDMFNITDEELFELRRKTGMVFQNAALFDSMTVWENVGFSLLEHSKLSEEEIRQKAQDVLLAVGLSDILDKMPEELSGGMRKRVGIARALMVEPEILFYDEPTAGLDVITASSILSLMKNIHSQFNTTDVIVTHDLTIARDFADRIVVINEGEILAAGRWDDLLTSDNDFVNKMLRQREITK